MPTRAFRENRRVFNTSQLKKYNTGRICALFVLNLRSYVSPALRQLWLFVIIPFWRIFAIGYLRMERFRLYYLK